MTPQENGDEFIGKFSTLNDAIKAVEEIIKEAKHFDYVTNCKMSDGWATSKELYWNDVLNYLKSKL